MITKPSVVWTPIPQVDAGGDQDWESFNGNREQVYDIKYIFIHTTWLTPVGGDTSGGTAQSNINYWKSAGSGGASAQYVIDSGTIYQVVADNDIAYHAGQYSYNKQSIGIEIVATASVAGTISSSELLACAKLVSWLCQTYNIPVFHPTGSDNSSDSFMLPAGIIGHSQVSLSGKTDPGPYFDWNNFIDLVNSAGNTNAAPVVTVLAGTTYTSGTVLKGTDLFSVSDAQGTPDIDYVAVYDANVTNGAVWKYNGSIISPGSGGYHVEYANLNLLTYTVGTGTNDFQVEAVDNSGAVSNDPVFNITGTVANSAPVVTVLAGTSYISGTVLKGTDLFSVSDAQGASDIDYVAVYDANVTNGAVWKYNGSIISPGSGGYHVEYANLNLLTYTVGTGTNDFQVEAVDNSGAVSNDPVFNITGTDNSDHTPPTLSSTSPADNAANVAVDANIVLTFSESVKAGSGNIVIHDAGTNGAVATISVTDSSQVSFSGSTMTVNPAANLNAGGHYYVTLGSGVVTDAAGNPFAGISSSSQFDFSTAPLSSGPLPDITISNVEAAVLPSMVSVYFDVNNTGNAASSGCNLRIYFSQDDIPDASDVSSVISLSSVAANSKTSNWAGVSLPGLAGGTYHLILVADSDGQVAESHEDNNSAETSVTLGTISPPDLYVDNLSLGSSTVAPGNELSLNLAVSNHGGTDAPAFQIAYYLSTDDKIDAGDTVLDVTSTTAMPIETGRVVNDTVTIPGAVAGGQYYVIASVDSDNQISEISETNNISKSIKITVSSPVHIVNGDNGPNTLPGTPTQDVINGRGGDDILNGLDGNDTLDGGTGADTMSGSYGDDTYIVDNPGDKVTEFVNRGTDLVKASTAYTLPDNVENLTLTGTGNLNGTGNKLGTRKNRVISVRFSAHGDDSRVSRRLSRRLFGRLPAFCGCFGGCLRILDRVMPWHERVRGRSGGRSYRRGSPGSVLPRHA